MSPSSLRLKPFLRWVGGKSWLSKHLQQLDNLIFENYHEPFLGGAATFFYLRSERKSYLSDLNPELINAYLAVRDDLSSVIKVLKKFENNEQYYYHIRTKRFDSSVEDAAKFIYLNQTSFNGIYRVNLKGEYNVPYGFRLKNFLDEAHLHEVSLVLKNVELSVADFDIVKQNLSPADLVFLDPPYTVSHNNNGFIKYNEKLFSLDDQYRLKKLVDYISATGAFYILTNAAHYKIKEIFESDSSVYKVGRVSLIGGLNAQRGNINELIFTNIDKLMDPAVEP